MVYHAVTIGPTQAQMASLASGDSTHIPSKNIQGDIPFHLTTAQLKRLEKAHASGKGCLIKLSPAQVKLMAQRGSGRFTDFLKAGYEIAKPGLRLALAKGANMAENAVADRTGLNDAPQAYGAAPHVGEGFFGDLLKSAAHGGVDLVANKLGAGIRKPRARKPKTGGWIGSDIFGGAVGQNTMGMAMPAGKSQRGQGFFGNILKQVAHGGVDLVANKLGAGVAVNPRSTPNEGLRAALFQKKVISGGGLFQ